jgi:hypothetical protein
LVEPQNQGGGGFLGLGLKTGSYGLVSQNHRDGFLVWASKPSRLRFIGCATKPMGGCNGVGHTSRSSGLFHVEATLTRVSQSDLETGGVMTMGDACGTIMEVASESS